MENIIPPKTPPQLLPVPTPETLTLRAEVLRFLPYLYTHLLKTPGHELDAFPFLSPLARKKLCIAWEQRQGGEVNISGVLTSMSSTQHDWAQLLKRSTSTTDHRALEVTWVPEGPALWVHNGDSGTGTCQLDKANRNLQIPRSLTVLPIRIASFMDEEKS